MKSILVIGALVLATRVDAAQVIDQQVTASNTFLGNSAMQLPTLGQSFTPTLASIDFATFTLRSNAFSQMAVQLHVGSGFGGTVLGTSSVQSLVGLNIAQAYQFDFAAPITLLPGNVYTLQVVVMSGPQLIDLSGAATTPSALAGGSSFLGNASGASAFQDFDYQFSEGYTTPAVPEPASVALLLAGLGLLGLRSGFNASAGSRSRRASCRTLTAPAL